MVSDHWSSSSLLLLFSLFSSLLSLSSLLFSSLLFSSLLFSSLSSLLFSSLLFSSLLFSSLLFSSLLFSSLLFSSLLFSSSSLLPFFSGQAHPITTNKNGDRWRKTPYHRKSRWPSTTCPFFVSRCRFEHFSTGWVTSTCENQQKKMDTLWKVNGTTAITCKKKHVKTCAVSLFSSLVFPVSLLLCPPSPCVVVVCVMLCCVRGNWRRQSATRWFDLSFASRSSV